MDFLHQVGQGLVKFHYIILSPSKIFVYIFLKTRLPLGVNDGLKRTMMVLTEDKSQLFATEVP